MIGLSYTGTDVSFRFHSRWLWHGCAHLVREPEGSLPGKTLLPTLLYSLVTNHVLDLPRQDGRNNSAVCSGSRGSELLVSPVDLLLDQTQALERETWLQQCILLTHYHGKLQAQTYPIHEHVSLIDRSNIRRDWTEHSIYKHKIWPCKWRSE